MRDGMAPLLRPVPLALTIWSGADWGAPRPLLFERLALLAQRGTGGGASDWAVRQPRGERERAPHPPARRPPRTPTGSEG
jgi:hypothetical protein